MATSKSYRDITDRTSSYLAVLRRDIPETTKGFGALSMAVNKDGALDRKTKELISLALSVAARCDPCVGYHAEAAVKLGITREQIEEMLGVCVYMGGGPALMYAAEALAAFEEFSKPRQAV